MSKLKLFYVLLIAIAFNSCEKIQYKKVHIKGTFWDYCGEQPLANFSIQMIEGKNSNYESKIIAQTTTDNNGNFDFGEISIRKSLAHYNHIYAVYNSDNDMLSRGVGDVAPYNVKNTTGLYINMQNKEQVLKDELLSDTIRACGLFYKNYKITPSPPYTGFDTTNYKVKIYLKHKYIIEDTDVGDGIALKYIKPNGYTYNEPAQPYAGNYIITVVRERNGVVIDSVIDRKYYKRKEQVVYEIKL